MVSQTVSATKTRIDNVDVKCGAAIISDIEIGSYS